MSTQIEDLYEKFEVLQARMDFLENSKSSVPSPAGHELETVTRITREAFGADPVFRLEQYIECEGSYVVVEVPAMGTDEEIDTKSDQWHREIARQITPTSSYCLSLLFGP
jgi:hypothetical protein